MYGAGMDDETRFWIAQKVADSSMMLKSSKNGETK